jgi:hypothetical protein
MKLSTVASITLVMITVGFLLRVIQNFSMIFAHPMHFLTSSIDSWALMFFFFMLFKHSRES